MVVNHKGIENIKINSELLIKQGKESNLFDIIEVRSELMQWLDSPESMYALRTQMIPGQKDGLNDYYNFVVNAIETLEFELQDLWGFDRDRKFHSYWYKVEGCLCPKMDNKDLIGTDKRIQHFECPYHGD